MKQSTKKVMILLGVTFSLLLITLITQGFCMTLAAFNAGVNPCQNGGELLLLDTYIDVDGYYGCHAMCICKPGYTGEFCEIIPE